MARMGKFSCSDLKKLQKQLESLETQRDTFMDFGVGSKIACKGKKANACWCLS